MSKVRIGIIGFGNMGTTHAHYLVDNKIKNAELTAICDIKEERLEYAKKTFGDNIALFTDYKELYKSGKVDGVLIATPHYDHPTMSIEAFENNLHVLTEKPAGVYTKQVRLMNEAAEKSDKVFGIMYNMRTMPIYQKLKDLIDSGELGEIKRSVWIITNWYRSQSYYDSGTWRATWSGEGGGVLLNQDPHQLDLWQWICGMPTRVRAFCSFGKHRNIEVEDDVTAYVEYENGQTGVFITTTCEAPGTNRLEISGDRGKIVVEDGKINFWRLRTPESQFNKEYKGGFGEPECWKCEIPVNPNFTGHAGITQNWVNAILFNEPLLAPGEEGIKGLTLSNAMHLSTWKDGWVTLPVDEEEYCSALEERIEKSTFKKSSSEKVLDTNQTYGK